MSPSLRKLFGIFLVAGFVSCTNYHLSADSLRAQLAGIDSTRLKMVTVRGPVGERYEYLANPIDFIDCEDKRGVKHRLQNSPSIEMRVTNTDGKRSVFYFDRVMATDSALYGVQSRFVSSIRGSVRWQDVKQIEIQDGKKNFVYISK